MKKIFPLKVFKFNDEEKNIFDKYFAEDNGEFYFEGMWFRSQRIENAESSGYKDESTKRRRYLHFYNTYVNVNDYLTLKHFYLYVSNTLPKDECNEYLNRIIKALIAKNFEQTDKNIWEKQGLQIIINNYSDHPMNKKCGASFPKNYTSVDVVAVSKGYNYLPHYTRMWEHSTKLFRLPGVRENPTYINNVNELEKYLPAQVEFGCGPSIETGIDPLYVMHETYRVQNHETKKFYFASDDDVIEKLVLNPKERLLFFSQTPKKCIQAEHSAGYNIFNDLYKKGIFVGTVFNNNFDRLIKRFDIDDKILRTYRKDLYIQKLDFDKKAKSLICFGVHADRREVEKQARERGLKVIFVDPEGFYNTDFEPYPIEAPKTQDIVLQMTFDKAMQEFKKVFLD